MCVCVCVFHLKIWQILNILERHVKGIKTARMKKSKKDSIQGLPDGLQSGISLLICHTNFKREM
jgi:hypothetical protein